MADQRRTITIVVMDEFSRPLKTFEVGVGSAAEKVKGFQKTMGSGGGFMSGVRNIRDMTMAFNGMVQSIGAVASAVDEFATLGTTARRNEFVLKKLTGTTKEYEAAINAVTTALKGTVTEGEAAAIASQLLNLGLADSAEGIEEFTRISNVIAAMSPTIKTADEAIAQIGLTIANMSFMRLDQLGLSVADVKNRMKELQAATKGMTTEAAFQQSVMEGLSAKADLLGDGLIEIGGAQERLKAKFRGFKEELAKEVSAGLDAAVTSGEQLYTILDQLSAREFVIAVVTEITGSQETGKKVGDAGFLGVDLLNLGAAALEIAGLTTRTQEVKLEITSEFNFAERDRRLADLLTGEDSAFIQAKVTMGEVRPQTLGTGLLLPGMGGADGLVIPVRLEVEEQSKLSVMDEIFGVRDEILGVSKEFDPATSGFALAREEAAKLHAELKGGAQAAREIVGNITEIAAPENLGEMFGIAPESFDLSVYAAMQEALGDVEIDADLAAAAVENFKLQTGMATGASEIFAGQMDVLAQDLASGALSADQYVAAVLELSQFDFSQMDSIAAAMIDQGDVQLAQEFIDVLSAPGGVDVFEQGMANAQKLFEGLGLLDVEEVETPLDPVQEALDQLNKTFGDLPETWGEPVGKAMNLATGEFEEFTAGAIEDLGKVEKKWTDITPEMVSVELFDSGNLELAQSVLEMVAGQSFAPAMQDGVLVNEGAMGGETFDKAVQNAGTILEKLGLIESAGAESERGILGEALLGASIKDEILNDLDLVVEKFVEVGGGVEGLGKPIDEVSKKFKSVEKEWAGPVEMAMAGSAGYVEEFKTDALGDIAEIQAAMEGLSGELSLTVSTSWQATEQPSEVGGFQEFAEGGFTGTGTQPFLAMLHPNELVIPLDDLGAPGGGMQAASSGPTFVETTLMVNDFILAQAVTEAKRKEGATV